MTSYKGKCDKFRQLLPFYVNGSLSEDEAQEVMTSFQGCPDFKQEIDEWKEMQRAYREIEEALPEPSPFLYSKIKSRIRETENSSFFARLLPSRKFSLALIAVQFVLIIVLGIYTLQLRSTYQTLSAPSIIDEAGVKINVVFKEEATETEIRSLLFQVGGKIVDGPSSSGLYVIGIGSDKQVDHIIQNLKQYNIIVFAEKAY